MVQEKLTEPFFITNGDVLTKVNFKEMLENHKASNADISVGIRDYQIEIPYGIIETQGNRVVSMVEKPTLDYLINAGVYVASPNVIDLIPQNKFFHMTDLIKECLNRNMLVVHYYISDYWLDIGKINDYYKANFENSNYFL